MRRHAWELWAAPPPPGGAPPMHTTWTNAVAVDPGGRYPEGTLVQVNVNGAATSRI